jgi:dephospho-CoA kinase
MHVFGLTGGIASGKSAVAARLASRGVPIIDTDVLAREVVAKGTDGLAAIVHEFGEAVLAPDGTLDRKALGTLVFADEMKRKLLNAITHPRIAAAGIAQGRHLAQDGHLLACYEAALIVENGLTDAFRPLIVVVAPENVQIARIVARDHMTEAEARARISAQATTAQKVRVADFVIENDGTLADLERKTDETLRAICLRTKVDPARYGLC